MAHHMKARDIQFGLAVAWHKLTKVVEVITDFGFDLVRESCQLRGNNVEGVDWIVATDDGLPIGMPIAQSFQFLSNVEWIANVRNAMSMFPGSVIESLGTFDDRAKRYVTIKLGDTRESFKIGERVFNTRLNYFDALDGQYRFRRKGSETCQVCHNTCHMSLSEKSDLDQGAKHSKTHKEQVLRMDEAFEALFLRSADFERLFANAEETPIDENRAHLALLGWLGEGKEASTRLLNQANRMKELFLTGAGNRGQTGLDLISAVTDYYSHESAGKLTDGRDLWKQFASSEIGSGDRMKDQFIADIRTKDFRFNKQALGSLVKQGELTLSLSN